MTKIDLTIDKGRRKNAIRRARERNIVIPTYSQMKDPAKIPAAIKEDLEPSVCGICIRGICFASPGTMSRRPAAAALAASTIWNFQAASRVFLPVSSCWWASGSRPVRTRSARLLAVWCHGW